MYQSFLYILFFLFFFIALLRSTSAKGSVYKFGFPAKPHIVTVLQSSFICLDIVYNILNLPLEVKCNILGHLGANNADLKILIDSTLDNFDILEKSFWDNISEQEKLDYMQAKLQKTLSYTQEYKARDLNCYKQQQVHLNLQKSVKEQVSDLIQKKNIYESITKDYKLVNNTIKANNITSFYRGTPIKSINDMMSELHVYKDMTKKK